MFRMANPPPHLAANQGEWGGKYSGTGQMKTVQKASSMQENPPQKSNQMCARKIKQKKKNIKGGTQVGMPPDP